MSVVNFKKAVMVDKKNSGFVIAHRDIEQTIWYKNINARLVYLHLLLRVSHSGYETVFNDHSVKLSVGQYVTKESNLAQVIQGTKNQAAWALKVLEKHGVITRYTVGKLNNKCTIITLNLDEKEQSPKQSVNNHAEIEKQRSGEVVTISEQSPKQSLNQERSKSINKKTIGETSSPQSSQQEDFSLETINPEKQALNKPKKQSANKLNIIDLINYYHEILPDMPSVILPLSEKRKNKIKTLSRKYGLTNERWQAYFNYVANNCQWMTEQRQDHNTGKVWRKKNLDYLIKEDCYITVKEQRANDY